MTHFRHQEASSDLLGQRHGQGPDDEAVLAHNTFNLLKKPVQILLVVLQAVQAVPGHVPHTGADDDEVWLGPLPEVLQDALHVGREHAGDEVEAQQVVVREILPHLPVVHPVRHQAQAASFHQLVLLKRGLPFGFELRKSQELVRLKELDQVFVHRALHRTSQNQNKLVVKEGLRLRHLHEALHGAALTPFRVLKSL